MHIDWSSPILTAGLVFGVMIGLVARYFIFRASCALVDLEPSHIKSLVIVLFALAITLGVCSLMAFVGTKIMNVSEATFLYILWNLIGVAAVWAILGAIYIPALPVSVGKGFFLSGYEIVLGLLANTLVLAMILVICAAIQIATNSGPTQSHSGLPALPPVAVTTPAL